MTIHLTPAQAALLARTAHRIAYFCEKSPNTAALLQINTQQARDIQALAQKIAAQLQQNLQQQLAP